jgi:alpha-L-fucosidase
MLKRICVCLLLSAITLLVHGQTRWTKIHESLLFADQPFNNCHASTIVETRTGALLMACFGGSQEGKSDVAIWCGKIDSLGHAIPMETANGIVNSQQRFACWNPVLFKKHNGQLVLFYKVGPDPRDWWGMYKTSDDNGQTWSGAMRLPPGILGPIKNKPIELKNGNILCPTSVELASGRWKAYIERTNRKLKKWKTIPVDTASKFDVIQPSILFYGGKNLQLLCRSKQGNVIQSRSDNNGKAWSPLTKTVLLNPNSGTDAVTLKDGKQLIVYNPSLPGKSWSNGRSELRVAMSTDGEHWEDIAELEHGTTEEYSYPAIIQTNDGLIHITYTYDRKNIKYVVLREDND